MRVNKFRYDMSDNKFKLRAKYAKKYNLQAASIVDTRLDNPYNNRDSGFRNDILQQAYNCWMSLDYWRRDCKRNEMFVDGDQWGDYTKFFDGQRWRHVSERNMLIEQGCIPMTNNVLIAILHSITGILISNQTEPMCISRTDGKQEAGEIMTATLQYVYQNNKLWDLDREGLKEFFTHGVKMGKLNYCRRESHKKDIYFYDVAYDRLFFDNTMEDKRNWDCNIIGAFYDLALVDVLALFSNGSEQKASTIKTKYHNLSFSDETVYYDSHARESSAEDEKDFYSPTGANYNKCRVFDIWRKERKERIFVHDYKVGEYYKAELSAISNIEAENDRRREEITHQVTGELGNMQFSTLNERNQQIKILVDEYCKLYLIVYERDFDMYWVNYCLSPDGYVLYEKEFPFCPIVLKRDLGADGKIHSYVSYFIDQQKSINRNRSVQDDINRRSIKGVTSYDERTLGENTKQDIEHNLSKPGAVIFYDGKNGNPPEFHNATAQNTGALQLMQSDLEMIDKISGSSNAVQGMKPNSGTPAALYAQQTQNSVGVLSSLLDSYREYREDRDKLAVKMIQEFYDEKMYVNIHSSKDLKLFEPSKYRDVLFEVSIVESQSTPTFRMMQDNLLQQWVSMGLIPLEVALQAGSYTFKDNLMQLLEDYKKKQQQEAMVMQQQAQMQGNLPIQQ
ncbi:hypothetical protein FACS189413_17990 [Bacteroidia bacterium]|nr:hypothetical protein FACS189413_17990 [Bacteroidia bacterium]